MGELIRLETLTSEEVATLAPSSSLVLPTAAIEQHGPHLPLGTDMLIVKVVSERATALAADEVPVVLAPPLPYGNSQHHLFACALSLTSTTFIQVIRELIESTYDSGFRRVFILNAHGGNDECVRLVAKDMTLKLDLAIAACSYWDVAKGGLATAGIDGLFRSIPGHAGGFETSVMQALMPDQVRSERIPEHDPMPAPMMIRDVAAGLSVQQAGEWRRSGGYTDGARAVASADKGRRILDVVATAVAKSIVSFHEASWETAIS